MILDYRGPSTPPPPVSPKAIACFVGSLFCCPCLLGPLFEVARLDRITLKLPGDMFEVNMRFAIWFLPAFLLVLSIVSRWQIRRDPGRPRGSRLAGWAIAFCILWLAMLGTAVVLDFYLVRPCLG